MKRLNSILLGSAALLSTASAVMAADLPVTKAAPVEYVRICSAYGAGFFYIPGTDTCLRISGRARYEFSYIVNENRNVGTQVGDITGTRGLLRVNLDARTQTAYGTLRAFARIEMAGTSGAWFTSGTRQRNGTAFPALGLDQFSRAGQFVNADKAFIQFAGLTAGRASSFFDFYAHDFELIGGSAGSDVFSTNLLAYTATLGNGFSATLSIEDPNMRHNNIYNATSTAAAAATGSSSATVFFNNNALTPLILAQDAAGNASIITFQDVIEKSRMPTFVGVARYDAAWGSAQLSAAVKDLNISGTQGNGFVTAAGVAAPANAPALLAGRGLRGGSTTDYGWAVQGGIKVNVPFISPGDTFYLQGAYGEGANNYVGVTSYTGQYSSALTPTNGAPFSQFLADAALNPLTGRIDQARSFSAVGAYLHYWSPEWRSAFFGSYLEINYPAGTRAAVSLTQGLVGATAGAASIVTSPALFALSPVLRDSYQIYAGASLIWSPVKDLDIGVEGAYLNTGMQRGRVLDQSKVTGVTAANFNTLLAAGAIRTVNNYDAAHLRFRVQRDF